MRKSLVSRLKDAGVIDEHGVPVTEPSNLDPCLVDKDGLFLTKAHISREQAERLQAMLLDDEAILVLPAYYLHDLNDGCMPISIVRKMSRWLITRAQIYYLPLSRSYDPYRPKAGPDSSTWDGKVFAGIWQDRIDQVIRQVDSLAPSDEAFDEVLEGGRTELDEELVS